MLDARRLDLRHSQQFAIFAFLMALGVLFHQSILSDWRPFSHHMPLSLAAIWVVFRPRSVVAFLVMITLHFVSFAIDLPYVVNHWMFVGIIDIAIIFAALINVIRNRSIAISGAALYRDLAPSLRVSVIVMYTFAAFAKLNWDFFDLELSAAVSLYGDLADKVRVLPRNSVMHTIAMFGTAALECSLPVLLVFRRTRVVGIFIAFGFHFAMGVAGFIPFSGFALALLFLFAPDEFVDRLDEIRRSESWILKRLDPVLRWSQSVFAPLVVGGLWIMISCARTYEWLPANDVRMAVIRGGQALFAIYYLLAGGLFCWIVFVKRIRPHSENAIESQPPKSTFATSLLWIAPILLVANGLCPYLGLKTESSFTMYSNLQTEGAQWNHVLMPSSFRIFEYQNDLVRVLESTDPELQAAADEGIQLTWFEFKRRMRVSPETLVKFEYRDRIIEANGNELLERFATNSSPMIVRTLFWFRDVPPREKNTIRH
ncbi:MAG: HTTM domain-containing protein [bacterium]|nr:HTTM domain-containing protein [bacterium]